MVSADRRDLGGSLSSIGLGVNQGLVAANLWSSDTVGLQKTTESMSSDEGRFES